MSKMYVMLLSDTLPTVSSWRYEGKRNLGPSGDLQPYLRYRNISPPDVHLLHLFPVI